MWSLASQRGILAMRKPLVSGKKRSCRRGRLQLSAGVGKALEQALDGSAGILSTKVIEAEICIHISVGKHVSGGRKHFDCSGRQRADRRLA